LERRQTEHGSAWPDNFHAFPVNTSGSLTFCAFLSCMLTLTRELPEDSDQFRFLRAACLPNLKVSVGLIVAKVSVMRVSIPRRMGPAPPSCLQDTSCDGDARACVPDTSFPFTSFMFSILFTIFLSLFFFLKFFSGGFRQCGVCSGSQDD